MGAFFLYKSEEYIDSTASKETFSTMGFSAPKEFKLGSYILWLYRKQLVQEQNFYLAQNGSSIFVTGTIIYKGKSYSESLVSLLIDFEHNSIDSSELIGDFCVLFFTENHLTIMHDRQNNYQVFVNEKRTVISSSFLALINSHLYKVKLNKMACLEYLTTLYVIAPNTFIDGIYLLTKNFEKQINNPDYSIFAYPPNDRNQEYLDIGFSDSVDFIIKSFQKYWKSIENLIEQNGMDLGLSGGYDSRMILLMSEWSKFKITTHSHDILGNSGLNNDLKTAQAIANAMGVDNNIISIPQPQDFEKNLKENLFWHDGHSPTELFESFRTKSYRIECLGTNRLSLSGGAGEIFKNRFFQKGNRLSFNHFIRARVLTPSGSYIISKKSYRDDLIESILHKASDLLDINGRKYINEHITKRYYSEIYCTTWYGYKISTENQLAFYLSPFMDYNIVQDSYKVIPYIGYDRKFCTELLMRMNKDIANMQSSYGYRFSKVPLSKTLKIIFRSHLPNSMEAVMGYYRTTLTKKSRKSFDSMYPEVKSFRDSIEVLKEADIPIKWNEIRNFPREMTLTVNLGYLLNSFSQKISVS